MMIGVSTTSLSTAGNQICVDQRDDLSIMDREPTILFM